MAPNPTIATLHTKPSRIKVIGAEDQAAREQDGRVPRADATKPGDQQPAIQNFLAHRNCDDEQENENRDRLHIMDIDPYYMDWATSYMR
jgi:hypothetical protein